MIRMGSRGVGGGVGGGEEEEKEVEEKILYNAGSVRTTL